MLAEPAALAAPPGWDAAFDVPKELQHNKTNNSQILGASGPHLEAWKKLALRTTNQVLTHVPSPPVKHAEAQWLRVMERSHTGILRPGAMQLLEEWQANGASKRQKEALSELLHNLQDQLNYSRGRTVAKQEYGPKAMPEPQPKLFDPYHSSMGRPSSAPIAHAIHMKAEERKREEDAAKLQFAGKLELAPKTKVDPSQRNSEANPFKWPGAERYFGGNAVTSTQAQMRGGCKLQFQTITGVKGGAATSSHMNRTVGGPGWHGDAQHALLRPIAQHAFPFTPEQMPRTEAYHRMKRYVI